MAHPGQQANVNSFPPELTVPSRIGYSTRFFNEGTLYGNHPTSR